MGEIIGYAVLCIACWYFGKMIFGGKTSAEDLRERMLETERAIDEKQQQQAEFKRSMMSPLEKGVAILHEHQVRANLEAILDGYWYGDEGPVEFLKFNKSDKYGRIQGFEFEGHRFIFALGEFETGRDITGYQDVDYAPFDLIFDGEIVLSTKISRGMDFSLGRVAAAFATDEYSVFLDHGDITTLKLTAWVELLGPLLDTLKHQKEASIEKKEAEDRAEKERQISGKIDLGKYE
jgi:hypothetical protein